MAIVTKEVDEKEVEVVTKVKVKEETITLRLSSEETEELVAALGRIDGKHINNIKDELRKCGYAWQTKYYDKPIGGTRPSAIYFKK